MSSSPREALVLLRELDSIRSVGALGAMKMLILLGILWLIGFVLGGWDAGRSTTAG